MADVLCITQAVGVFPQPYKTATGGDYDKCHPQPHMDGGQHGRIAMTNTVFEYYYMAYK